MKNAVTLSLVAICLLPSLVAHADETPLLEVVDTGPDAIIVGRHLELANESFKVRSNRLEVSLRGTPPALAVKTDDPTIAAIGIRVRSTGERRLTITIKAGRQSARRLARTAVVRQVGDSVQVITARKVGASPAAAFIEDLDEADEGLEQIDEPVKTTAAAAGLTAARPTESAAKAAPVSAAPKPSKGGIAGSVIGLLFIFAAAIACGLGYREWQKRRPGKGRAVLSGIDVLSSRSIGPKTRLLLVAVGAREMLLTVGPTGSTVLGRWKRNETGDESFDHDPYLGDIDEVAAPLAAPPQPAPSRAPARVAPARVAPPRAAPARVAPPRVAPAQPAMRRAPTNAAAAYSRRSLARGSTNPDSDAVGEWNHRPTSPAIRGILELRDQTLALDDVLGQSDNDVDVEWEQALAGGTRTGRLR